jgi:hypothetical protein
VLNRDFPQIEPTVLRVFDRMQNAALTLPRGARRGIGFARDSQGPYNAAMVNCALYIGFILLGLTQHLIEPTLPQGNEATASVGGWGHGSA